MAINLDREKLKNFHLNQEQDKAVHPSKPIQYSPGSHKRMEWNEASIHYNGRQSPGDVERKAPSFAIDMILYMSNSKNVTRFLSLSLLQDKHFSKVARYKINT